MSEGTCWSTINGFNKLYNDTEQQVHAHLYKDGTGWIVILGIVITLTQSISQHNGLCEKSQSEGTGV